jgi:hypothetical protein
MSTNQSSPGASATCPPVTRGGNSGAATYDRVMKTKLAYAAALMAAFLTTGCAVQKQLVPTGGSRADGTIKMSYQYGAFEAPTVDYRQAADSARQRCSAWGYSGAEPFGGSTSVCVGSYQGSCNTWQVTVEYQCTGTPSSSK